jgi:hypothetical protein
MESLGFLSSPSSLSERFDWWWSESPQLSERRESDLGISMDLRQISKTRLKFALKSYFQRENEISALFTMPTRQHKGVR